MLLKQFIRIFTIYFLAGWILANPSAWAQTKKDKSVDWQNLDLTGSYYKKKTKKGIALWPIIVVGAAGAGAAGYFIYKGSLTKIEANDDQVSVSCQISTTIDVLANDRGDGMEIMEVFGQPEGIQIFITPNGNLTIDNVGNDNFSFNYRIRDKYDKEAEAAVQVEVKASQLQAVDDFYALEGGELLEGNVLENDEGILITVIDNSEFSSGTVQVNENGDFTLNASDTICGINSFTYTARDFCDNVDTATVYVASSDDEAPIITCPAEMTLECTDDTSPDSAGQPDVTDNCDVDPQISYTDNLFDGNCPSNKTLERTWTAVDISQNSSSCVQTIQIRDNTPPSITCPANISLTCGESLDPVATGRATATDNCTATEDIVIDYSDNLSGLTDCGGSTGTIIRTWIARDLCGNESQCVQNINISDDVPPVIFCPPNLIIGCDQGIDPETTSRPTASDNCTSAESINYTYVDNVSGAIDCSASGVVSRTWTATDLCGNYNTCIQVINVETVPGPDITCPPEAGVSCDEGTDPSLTGRPSAVSNCSKPGEITFDYHDNSGGLSGCGNTGVLVRTWTATDPCNISSTCIQNINVVDNTPPVLNCPSDITISCDAGTDPANTGTATATDNCSAIGDVTVNYTDDFSGMNGCGNTGKILRTWTASDDCGNMISCEQSITIQDTTPPVITCPADITVNCSASLDPAALGSATATDNCVSNGNITIEYSDNTSGLTGCGGTGTIIRTWTATDPCGNSSSCTQTINILDNVPPVINCPADITVSCDQDLAPSVTGEPTVTDDCSADEDIAVSYSDDASGRTGCNGTGIVVRTWIARDACGNISQCTQDITIEDATPPIITCPADVIVNCEESTVPANTGNATATDNCTAVGEVDITFTDDVSGLTGCNGTGTLLRTWTATDLCGNQSHCIQNITIQDNTPPVITCPPNINIMCDESTDPSNTGQATATDNCTLEGNVLITYSDMVSGALDCSGDGRIDRTWTATDACGNIQTCVQTINVRSIGGPSINCPANITISCEDDTSPDNTGKPVGATACTLPGELTFTYSDDLTGLTGCNGSGIILRTWTVTDPCDLSNSCEQTITIEDATPPVINCPAAVTISCDASRDPANTGGEATATDNCSADADIVIDFSDNDTGLTGCNGSGILVRTWTATDGCGNVSQCTQHITIEDTTSPAIACPANIAITCDQSLDPAITGSPVVSDNCTAVGNISVAYNDIIAGPLNCSGVSTITRTWSATDLCGNSSSCVQTITMNPVSGPAITCPGDVTINCTDPTDPANTGGSATATTDCNLPGEITISHTDDFAAACGNSGVITRTWSATDACGLSSNCVQRITIQDVTPPVLTIPSDVAIECGASTDPADTGQGTATDCSTVTVTHSDATAGSCPEVITRTWTATDACGNVSKGDQRITIDDTTNPVLSVPVDVMIECGTSTDPADTGQGTATDCSTVTVTHSDATAGSCPEVITRTWTATDACGHVSTGTQTITIQDNTDPVLSVPVDVTIECGASTDPADTGQGTATDCSTVTVTHSDATAGSCPEVITRTWTATDACGHVSTGTQTITIQDNTDPVLSVPVDVTIECGASTDPADTGQGTATDCSPVTVTHSDATAGSCPEVITRTWTATDACGHVSTGTQTITIQDNTDPVLSLPPDIIVECGSPTDTTATGSATATDCSPVTVTHSDATAGSCPEVITRTWTATDACGHVSTGTQTITIQDNTDPVLSVPVDVTIECGASTDPADTGQGTATDCSTVTVTHSDATAGSCPEVITRTWTATDACGHMSTGDQRITIDDTTPPVITDCPPNLTLNCTDSTDPANTGTPTGTDDCSTVSFTPTDVETPGSCPAERTITRTWTATDDCGHSTTCTQVLTVVDNTAPTLKCPVDVTIGCTDSMDPSNTGNPTATTDDCSSSGITISYTDDDSHLDLVGCTGYKLRTWVATDECGNASPGCDQRISIGASGGRIAATPDGEEQSQQSGGSVLTNGSEFQYFIDDFNAVRLDVINTITIFNTSPVLYYKDMELWRTNGSYSFRADVSYRRYFANTWIRPFAGAGFVLYKDIRPGVYSNDYLNGQIAYSGDKYDYWIAYVSGGALIKINKFLYYELSLRMNKDFSTDPDALNIIKLRPSLNSRFLFMINRGGVR